MRIALLQINPTVGDLAGNAAAIVRGADEAAARGADLAITPEMAISGYPPEDLVLRPAFVRDCEEVVADLAHRLTLPVIVGSPWRDTGGVRNSALLLSDGVIAARYDKMALPNYSVFDEQRTFTPGTGPLLFGAGDALVGISICEDIWVEHGPAHAAAEAGADLVINLSASPFHLEKADTRDAILSFFARHHDCSVAYVNLVGGQDELVFDGRSLVYGRDGVVRARGAFCGEDLVLVDLALRSDDAARDDAITIAARIPVADHADQVPDHIAASPVDDDELWEVLRLGLRDYVEKNGFPAVLIGLSGGIDSALVAALATAALGADRVHAVSMPTRYNVTETRSDAERVASNLGIDFRELPIEELRLAFHAELPELAGLAAENLQARIRGVLLMALSNQHGWLVLATGNKSEVATGYSTLYGDSVGGLAPIKDVPKTAVHRLARHVNSLAGAEVIPVSTIERPPTAELRADQRDADSLPPYDVLDPILAAYIEDHLSPAEIAERGLGNRELVERVVRLVDIAEYKRRQSAPGIKVQPIAFGRDRRMPITNRYRPDHADRT